MLSRHPLISIIIPAWNEEKRIVSTLKSIHHAVGASGAASFPKYEVIVVDDGSDDLTYNAAQHATVRLRHERNEGKAAALETGVFHSKGEMLVFLDADLEHTAGYFTDLLIPILEDKADMCIAQFPPPMRKGGFGLVKHLAAYGIYRLSGFRPVAPLSGQRALRREVFNHTRSLSRGFGIEVGLTIDAARAGFRLQEVMIPFAHRETGRNLEGFIHRGKQFYAVGRTLMNRWRKPVC